MDRQALESKWWDNEAQLNRLYAAHGLDRELSVALILDLESEQDFIQWRLGSDGPPDSQRWAGAP